MAATEYPEKIVITDPKAIEVIVKYANMKDITNPDSAARLIATAKGRRNAVLKYVRTHPPKPAKKKAPAKAKAEVKAKAPRVRKAKKEVTPEPVQQETQVQ